MQRYQVSFIILKYLTNAEYFGNKLNRKAQEVMKVVSVSQNFADKYNKRKIYHPRPQ